MEPLPKDTVAFARVLCETYMITNLQDLLWFLETPNSYADEFEAWRKHGSPHAGDSNWEAFLADLNTLSGKGRWRW